MTVYCVVRCNRRHHFGHFASITQPLFHSASYFTCHNIHTLLVTRFILYLSQDSYFTCHKIHTLLVTRFILYFCHKIHTLLVTRFIFYLSQDSYFTCHKIHTLLVTRFIKGTLVSALNRDTRRPTHQPHATPIVMILIVRCVLWYGLTHRVMQASGLSGHVARVT